LNILLSVKHENIITKNRNALNPKDQSTIRFLYIYKNATIIAIFAKDTIIIYISIIIFYPLK